MESAQTTASNRSDNTYDDAAASSDDILTDAAASSDDTLTSALEKSDSDLENESGQFIATFAARMDERENKAPEGPYLNDGDIGERAS